jgi:putative spermidine/putrescine transport system permease protein
MQAATRRKRSFYPLAAFFTLFVLFLYGPMIAIFILCFQGPTGGMTFPMQGASLHWFRDLSLSQPATATLVAGSGGRSPWGRRQWC